MFNNNSDLQVKNKMIILQVLSTFGVPLTNDEATEFILENELINYFELQQYLVDLTDAKMIELNQMDNEERYFLTDSGKNTLDYFNNRLDQDLRRFINDQVESKKSRIIAHTNITADYFRLDNNEYLVELKVEENNSTLVNLQLNIVSNKHAKLICKNWEKDAQFLYGDILALLTTEKK
jgi:predicted transcriptional regulator